MYQLIKNITHFIRTFHTLHFLVQFSLFCCCKNYYLLEYKFWCLVAKVGQVN